MLSWQSCRKDKYKLLLFSLVLCTAVNKHQSQTSVAYNCLLA